MGKHRLINSGPPGHLVPSLSPRPHFSHFELEPGVYCGRTTRSSASATLKLLQILHLFPHRSLVFYSASKFLFGTTTQRTRPKQNDLQPSPLHLKSLCIIVQTARPRTRGGQTFPKSTEIMNSIAFRAFFSVFFRPFQSVAADSVSEQLLQLP